LVDGRASARTWAIAVEDPAFRTALEKLSSPAAYQDADEFTPWLDADAARPADVIKKIGKAG
jgi:tripartite-type tricarboxylate transporter receptor subunit TctC